MQYFFVSVLHSLPAFLSSYVGYSGYILINQQVTMLYAGY